MPIYRVLPTNVLAGVSRGCPTAGQTPVSKLVTNNQDGGPGASQ